jgi:hypothetical protein
LTGARAVRAAVIVTTLAVVGTGGIMGLGAMFEVKPRVTRPAMEDTARGVRPHVVNAPEFARAAHGIIETVRRLAASLKGQ